MRLSNVFGPTSILGFLVSEAVLATTCYVVAAVLLLNADPTVFLLYHWGLVRIVVLVGGILLIFYFQDLYGDLRVRSNILLVQQVCLVIGLAFLLQALLNYIHGQWVLPRWVMLTGSLLALAALPGWRIFYSRFLTSAQHGDTVVFLGCSNLAWKIHEQLQRKPELGLTSIGFVGNPAREGEPRTKDHLLGPLEMFRDIVRRHKVDSVVVAMPERRNRLPQMDLLELRFSGVRVEEAATAYEAAFNRVCVRELRPSQLIFSSKSGPRPQTALLQHIYSFVIAALGLMLSLPLMLLAALLVKITSPGPILYRQRRVGLNGKQFTLYKFRSMYNKAEARTGAVWAQENDPRITPLGRWLRRFRLDEIPQLVNVIKGEMSVVGPRPERPEFVDTLVREIPFYRQRLSVRPGITGWAQINHKYGDSLEDTITKLEYDLYYIKHLTPVLDAYIMFHTAKVILLGRGAQ